MSFRRYSVWTYVFAAVVGTARCAVRAAFSGARHGRTRNRLFRPLRRGRGHRSAMSLPGYSRYQPLADPV